MIILLSPSKSMDLAAAPTIDFTQPAFMEKSETLIDLLRTFSTAGLMDFMTISEKLTELNRERFKSWQQPFTLENSNQARLAFTGDVYDGLDAASLKKPDLTFAQKHLRILSGLYDLLRPLDLIQPYRLEMGRPLQTEGAKNLYEFWRKSITEKLNHLPGELLVNLAAQEYFKAIDAKQLNKKIISPVFKDEKNGLLKIISFYAKKARGSMARFIIENRISKPDELLTFDTGGYAYAPELSTASEPVYTRSEQSGGRTAAG